MFHIFIFTILKSDDYFIPYCAQILFNADLMSFFTLSQFYPHHLLSSLSAKTINQLVITFLYK